MDPPSHPRPPPERKLKILWDWAVDAVRVVFSLETSSGDGVVLGEWCFWCGGWAVSLSRCRGGGGGAVREWREPWRLRVRRRHLSALTGGCLVCLPAPLPLFAMGRRPRAWARGERVTLFGNSGSCGGECSSFGGLVSAAVVWLPFSRCPSVSASSFSSSDLLLLASAWWWWSFGGVPAAWLLSSVPAILLSGELPSPSGRYGAPFEPGRGRGVLFQWRGRRKLSPSAFWS